MLKTMCFLVLFVITCSVFGTSNGLSVRAQQPTLTPNERKTENKMVVTPRTQSHAQDKIKAPAVAHEIYGTIRWKKELGLPFAYHDDGSPTDETCFYGFYFDARYDPPYSVGGVRDRGKAKEENDYYVCNYHIPPSGSLALNRPLVVEAHFSFAKKGMTWPSASQPLPVGYEYRILDNPRTVTLTGYEPQVEVNFEISAMPALQVPTSPVFKRSSGVRRRTKTNLGRETEIRRAPCSLAGGRNVELKSQGCLAGR